MDTCRLAILPCLTYSSISMQLWFAINVFYVTGKFTGGDDLSGAYLFLPDGPAKEVDLDSVVFFIDGPVMKQVSGIFFGVFILNFLF